MQTQTCTLLTLHTHIKKIYFILCVSVCGFVHVSAGGLTGQRSETPGTGVISTCKPADVGAGN